MIAAAAAWGVGNLLIKRAAPPDPLRFMSWICVVPPVPLLCLSLAFEGPTAVGSALAHVDLGGIGAVLYLAFAATTVGWALWARLMGLYPASTVAPFALLVPIFGLGFAAALRGEPIGSRELIAAVLVLGGVLLTLLAPKPVRREAISPQLAGTS